MGLCLLNPVRQRAGQTRNWSYKHDYKDLPWPNGEGRASASCQVKGEEKIIVAAGGYDTVRKTQTELVEFIPAK